MAKTAREKTLSLPQSQWLWSPLPPLLVWLGLVAQACCWHQSQSACTARWGAANWPAPLHPCQDSTAPFRRGRSLRPGWNTGGWVKRSQELSGKKIQRTGRVGRWFRRKKHRRTGSPSFNRFQRSTGVVTLLNSKFRVIRCPVEENSSQKCFWTMCSWGQKPVSKTDLNLSQLAKWLGDLSLL